MKSESFKFVLKRYYSFVQYRGTEKLLQYPAFKYGTILLVPNFINLCRLFKLIDNLRVKNKKIVFCGRSLSGGRKLQFSNSCLWNPWNKRIKLKQNLVYIF